MHQNIDQVGAASPYMKSNKFIQASRQPVWHSGDVAAMWVSIGGVGCGDVAETNNLHV